MNFPEPLDGKLTDAFDPVSLLRCQLDASEIERHGQVLTLNDAGRRLPELDFSQCILNGEDARRYLCIVGEADREEKQGDPLEFSTAVTLLKLGVHRVQRSLRLKAKSAPDAGRRPHPRHGLTQFCTPQ